MHRLALLLLVAACSDSSTVPGGADAALPDAGSDARVDRDSAILECSTELDPGMSNGEWGIFVAGSEATATRRGQILTSPGNRFDVRVARLDCCYSFHAEPVCTAWEVEEGIDATITATTAGVASLDVGAVPPGTSFEVTARVGATELTTIVTISDPDDPALVGIWHEVRRYDCEGAELAAGSYPEIHELLLEGNNNITVTWMPFERYTDYWGDFDATDGAFTFEVTGGNFIPTDVDAEGTYEIVGSELHFRDLYLGTREGESAPACEHVFAR
jgi:hypothetical protein